MQELVDDAFDRALDAAAFLRVELIEPRKELIEFILADFASRRAVAR